MVIEPFKKTPAKKFYQDSSFTNTHGRNDHINWPYLVNYRQIIPSGNGNKSNRRYLKIFKIVAVEAMLSFAILDVSFDVNSDAGDCQLLRVVPQ